MSLFSELQRRNVFRVAIAYIVVAWVLLQIGDILFSTLELGPQPGKFLLAILLLAFIPVVVFAWAFEITPEGIKKEKDVARDESITNITAKKLDMVTIGLLLMALALFGVDKVMQKGAIPGAVTSPVTTFDGSQAVGDESTPKQTPASAAVEKSIAVLPFVNMSSDKEQEYFSDGITEEILNALARIKQLKVAGRTSSFAFKGKNDDLRLIGETLGVGHILEGSVRKAGNDVRITAQLIKVNDGFHMWSETYSGSLENVFDLQEDISRQVSNELKLVLNVDDGGRLASRMTGNIDAYDLFLRGRQHVRQRVNNNIPTGIALLERAVALDPDFAEAWAVLAEAEAVSVGYRQVDTGAAFARARAHIKKASELDPTLVLPYAVSGLIKSKGLGRDYLESLEVLQRALALEPHNVLTLRWLGTNYHRPAYFDKARPLLERAFSLDPLSRTDAFNLGAHNLLAGNLEEAKQYFHRTNELTGYLQVDTVAYILDAQGDHEGAIDYYMRKHADDVRQFGAGAAMSAAEAEQFARAAFGGDESMKQAARAMGKIVFSGPDDTAYWQLPGHIQLGSLDRAYEILQARPEFFSDFAADMMWAQIPAMIAFRQDARFSRLLEQFGVTEVWSELGWPAICQPDAGTDGSNGRFTCD